MLCCVCVLYYYSMMIIVKSKSGVQNQWIKLKFYMLLWQHIFIIYNLCEINCVQLNWTFGLSTSNSHFSYARYWFRFYRMCWIIWECACMNILFFFPRTTFNKIYEVNPKQQQKRSIEIDVFINWQKTRNGWVCMIWEWNSIHFFFSLYWINRVLQQLDNMCSWIDFCLSNLSNSNYNKKKTKWIS